MKKRNVEKRASHRQTVKAGLPNFATHALQLIDDRCQVVWHNGGHRDGGPSNGSGN